MASDEEDLSSKDLTELPKTVLEQAQLTRLFLDYNSLQKLPDNFGQCLPALKLLSAIGNSLSFLPDSFGQLANIEEIYLNENQLLELPDSICNLKCLSKLTLTGNDLQGLPENFGELSSLQMFNCEENNLRKLPKTFGLLESLEELELGCNLIEVLSEGFGKLDSLKILNLSSNKLSKLPDSFGELPHLRILDISANNLKFLPSKFSSVETIEKLYADNNILQMLPDWISETGNIVELSVKDNQFQNQTLPDEFPSVAKKLKRLDMSGNFMTHLPESLGEMRTLEFLHFGSVIGELERRNFQNGNWFSQIPDSLCQLDSLKELHLDENKINDLPDDFGNLVSLQVLDLGQNLLHNLPDSFGRLRSLRVCMISKNHLQWLPSNMGELSVLEDLRLDDNEKNKTLIRQLLQELSDKLVELPESFCQLSSLKTLDLFSNRLAEIPSALHNLKNLVRLDIDENDFHVPLSEIPQIVTKSKYPARDPNLKDNWRGRPRQDISNLDDHIIKEEGEELTDFEPPLPPLGFSEDVLVAAIKRNMSIWQSHGDGSSKRRPARRKRLPVRRYESGSGNGLDDCDDEDDDEEEDGLDGDGNNEEYDEDDEFEPPVVVQKRFWSGSVKPDAKPCQADVTVTAMLEEPECWDDELEEVEQYDNVPSTWQDVHPTKAYYPPVENGDFTFAPFDIHQPDYVKRPDRYGVEHGQFENCDADDTEEISVDPVF